MRTHQPQASSSGRCLNRRPMVQTWVDGKEGALERKELPSLFDNYIPKLEELVCHLTRELGVPKHHGDDGVLTWD